MMPHLRIKQAIGYSLDTLATPVSCFLVYRKELLYSSPYGKSFKSSDELWVEDVNNPL
jgi:hypothetical protein